MGSGDKKRWLYLIEVQELKVNNLKAKYKQNLPKSKWKQSTKYTIFRDWRENWNSTGGPPSLHHGVSCTNAQYAATSEISCLVALVEKQNGIKLVRHVSILALKTFFFSFFLYFAGCHFFYTGPKIFASSPIILSKTLFTEKVVFIRALTLFSNSPQL